MDSLIKIEGKPIEKLIEVISNGIGVLYKPRAIRKEADAKAYEIRVIERAKYEAMAEGKLIEADNIDRINERLVAKEINRQKNIDDVIEIDANDLSQANIVSDGPVERDWIVRFFDIVQDVSDEEMKNLWGKILAGEVKTPKSYSLRTLELLRNISKDEADIFVKISQFVLQQNDHFIFNGNEDGINRHRIPYSDIAKMTEIGLIQSGTFVHIEYNSSQNENNIVGIKYANLIIILRIKAGVNKVSIPVYCLTTAGKELYKLIDVTPNLDYVKDIGKYIKNDTVSVEYGEIISISDDGTINYKEPTMII